MSGQSTTEVVVPKDKIRKTIRWSHLMEFVRVAELIKDYAGSSGKVPTLKTIANSLGVAADDMSADLRAIEVEFGESRFFDKEAVHPKTKKKGQWVGGRHLFLRSEGDQLRMALTTEGERLAAVFSLISDIMRFHENTGAAGEVDPFLDTIAEVRVVAIKRLASIPRSTSSDVDEYFTSGELRSLGLRRLKAPRKPAHEYIEEGAAAYRARRKPHAK